ncbi:MAG: toprim domain-containing protein [Kiritimatiellaeota bacterium]|nr:toprim domain-containing protein [Kiritimatiellota bacterium]
MAAKAYNEDAIKSLSSLEHIRTRSGMYIGRIGDGTQYEDGIYVLVKEVFDNAIDEFIMGHGKKVEVALSGQRVSIRDYGRGIPLGKVVECVSQINTGGKFNDDVFQFSVGMNGVGTKAVNALSSEFIVRAFRDGDTVEARFKAGKLVKETKGKTTEKNGTYVEFEPDATIFKDYAFDHELLLQRFRMYSYLNPSLLIRFNEHQIKSDNGLLDLLNDEVQFEKIYPPFFFSDKTLEFTFTHTNRFNEEYYSFVNGQYTTDGGTHLSAFREGVLKGINEYSPKSKFDGDDVREGMVGAIAIRLKDPIFESQTKNKLGNTEIRADLVGRIRVAVLEMLTRTPTEAQKLITKIEETRKLRQELNNVKKLARERAKSISVHIPQLKDCKQHLDTKKGKGKDTMIFICEGQSAMGPLVNSRDPARQAVFALKGKPLNTCGVGRDVLYKNVELYNLTCALDIEENIDALRYQKVILATDADVDGLHIRNLMITFFMRFHERLLREGHVFILETPLFRVRNKKETHYCYTDAEREKAIAACGKSAEITRFKGLGEISNHEFKAFIGDTMRLIPVDITRDAHFNDTLEFYMGANTPDRKSYIMDNLVIHAEDMA